MAVLLAAGWAQAHGDVTPQAVDTKDVPKLGEAWRAENPYRGDAKAMAIGNSAYSQNCARCHGLEAISGGIAPDLRKMDNDCVALTDAKKKLACVKEVDEATWAACGAARCATVRSACRLSRAS